MAVVEHIKRILATTLQADESVITAMNESSLLLGSMPEFDSIAVTLVIAALEEQFGVTLDDDEISADVFESVGSLARFVERKLDALPPRTLSCLPRR